jgi:hypothetical protein
MYEAYNILATTIKNLWSMFDQFHIQVVKWVQIIKLERWLGLALGFCTFASFALH